MSTLLCGAFALVFLILWQRAENKWRQLHRSATRPVDCDVEHRTIRALAAQLDQSHAAVARLKDECEATLRELKRLQVELAKHAAAQGLSPRQC